MFKTLLLAVDVNDVTGMARCAEAAVNVAKSDTATLHILNVVPDSGMAIVGAMMDASHFDRMANEAKALLEAWAKETIPPEINAQLHVVRGTVYDQIIKTANKIDADAIFVGAHRPELKDYLIGPNSARVARHAKQSVFVVR